MSSFLVVSAPIYEELGARMKSRSDMTVAKIDYTANDVSVKGAEITGFPTVLLYKRGHKDKPVVYRGSRELMAFAEFIEAETAPVNSIRREL
jgi:protein disulfide-isomerase A1